MSPEVFTCNTDSTLFEICNAFICVLLMLVLMSTIALSFINSTFEVLIDVSIISNSIFVKSGLEPESGSYSSFVTLKIILLKLKVLVSTAESVNVEPLL